jgi:hypothetical protein
MSIGSKAFVVAADVLMLRAKRDQVDSAHTRERAEQALQRVQDAAERIREMTKLYKERQDGRVVRQP